MGTIHTIKNESGIFRIDEKGVMLEYICNPENVFSITEGKPYDIKKLIIPEGITEIPAHAFQFFVIRSELYLPSTLKILQDLALDITSAPDIVIPQNLEYIGYAVMMRGKIKSIKFPQKIHEEYRNMLRFAEVGKIYLPDKYVEKLNFNTLETVNVEKGQDNYTAISLVEGHMQGEIVKKIISQCIEWETKSTELLKNVVLHLQSEIEQKLMKDGMCDEANIYFQYVDHSCTGKLMIYNNQSIIAGACQRGNDKMVSNLIFRGTIQDCLDWLKSSENIGVLLNVYEQLQRKAELVD